MTVGPQSLSPGRPFLIELMGLPGAGKSTVFEALRKRNDRINTMPILRRKPHAPVLARHLVAILATLVRRRALGFHWSRDALVMMAYLQALPSVLEGPHRPLGDALVFDQGPIFSLTRPALLDERLEEWWEAMFAEWRSLLDAVVWLEAPDQILLERISARSKHHRLKGCPEAAALEVLARNRAVYDSVLARLHLGSHPPTILRFDTDRRAPDEIVDELLALIPAR